ncbi:MAG: amino acid adenylation domain-containing protein [Candidatus Aminicenantes bacterium]|jgi:amino acid adenylation domain-containing protein/non-ribosomal peptide synthase protein (TIGR01720 family)
MKKKNIEDIYPLSPLQQGMLFHTLYDREPGIYIDQLINRLHTRGDFNIKAFQQACDGIVNRHAVLRTAFIWERPNQPHQIVFRQIELPLEQQDWRQYDPGTQREKLKAFLDSDRNRGFNLAKAPLIRLTLLQIEKNTYQFIMSYHHMLLDAWSVALLFNQLVTHYHAFCRGQDLHLEAGRPYRDYIAWLRQQDLSQAEAYWKKTLQGFKNPTPLPEDGPFENTGSSDDHYDEQQVQVPAAKTGALNLFARKHRLTLSTLVQGAWALLLNRYSGENDIVFGLSVSGRQIDLKGIESMVGLFINTLPMRVWVSSPGSVSEWLTWLQSFHTQLRRYESTPLARIQSWSEVSHGLPLFNSVLAVENIPAFHVDLQEKEKRLEFSNGHYIFKTNYPLNVEFTPGETHSLRIVYDGSRFRSSTICRMLGHFQTLLEEFTAKPGQKPGHLQVLTKEERQLQLKEWNDTGRDFPKDRCIHQLVARQVEKTPDALAVVFEHEHMSYRELQYRADRLSGGLMVLGIGPEVLVGICVERSLEMIVGVLGILKAGGAYVPIDPVYPKERIAFMLKDAAITVLLTQERLLAGLPDHHSRVIALDNPDILPGYENRVGSTVETHEVLPKNTAYVIYTSGSTGKPKGVLLKHEGLCNLIPEWNRLFSVEADSHVLQFASFSFDASVWEIFSALVAGAALYLGSRNTLYSNDELLKMLRDYAITRALLPPSLLTVIPVEDLPALQVLSAIGEKCSAKIVERWAPGRQLFNAYGPAEATITVSVYLADSQEIDLQGPPIGRPIANIQLYILDRNVQPVPVGIPGELHIGGVGLATGYLNRPGLTAEKFIPDPFRGEKGARLYKTGDQARYRPDGNIEILGRIDHQVKIRGNRVEPAEIEAQLEQIPNIRKAVVTTWDAGQSPGEKRLIAYLVTLPDSKPSAREIRHTLEKKLPGYMLPSSFTFLEALPLTANGKVDRRSLPPPGDLRPQLQEAYEAPHTMEEKTLVRIWQEILGIEPVGIHDNFFELGGDSIFSIQIIAKARQAGLEFTPKQLFRYQTIAELMKVVQKTTSREREYSVVTGWLPLSPVQHRFFEQPLPQPHYFNQSMLLELKQTLSFSLLNRIARQLMIHHDALRLRFHGIDSSRQQRIARIDESVPVIGMDISVLADAEQEHAIQQAAADLQVSLNLSTGPLLRFALFELGVRETNRLLIIIHHLAVDGFSWRILLEDFQTLYTQLTRGETMHLPPKTASFKQWSCRLQEYAQEEVLRQEHVFWLKELQSHHFHLPVDHPGGANTIRSARVFSLWLDIEETRALLREVPEAYHTSIDDVLLAALVQSFSQWTGTRTLPIEIESHGREGLFADLDVSRTVGWFTNIFPVVLRIGEISNPGDLLKSIKEQLRLPPKRKFGYSLLRYLSDDPGVLEKLRALPQPEIIFNYMGQLDPVFSGSSLFELIEEFSGLTHSLEGKRRCLLEVHGYIINSQLQLNWTYSENLYRPATIEGLARGYMEALRTIITHCLSPGAGGYTPSDFPEVQLSQKKLDRVLEEIVDDSESNV